MNKVLSLKYLIMVAVAACAGAVLISDSSHAVQLDLANSNYRDNRVRWIAPDEYPRNTSTANWPLRNNRCSPISGYDRKTLYMQPSYGHFMQTMATSPIDEPYPSPPSQYAAPLESGNNAHWSSQCQNTPISPTSHRASLRWAFDAGTTRRGVSPFGVELASQGPWIYPHAIGGWALSEFPATGWNQATPTGPDYYTGPDPLHSGQMPQHEDGGSRCPCGDEYIIWSSNRKNFTNWFGTMVTPARSPFVPAPNSNPVNPGKPFGISSNGTTLFRNEFNITKETYDRIVAAEGTPGQGLFLDINADDFYHVYINGLPVVGSPRTVLFQQLPISSDLIVAALE